MDFENIRSRTKNANSIYGIIVDRMIDDLKFFLTIFKDSDFYDEFHKFSEDEIAAGLTALVQAANEGKINYKLIEKNFGVDERRVARAFNYLNAVLAVSYPDKRYTLEYKNFNEDETLLFSGFLTPGQMFWENFVNYAKKRGINDLRKLIEEKDYKKLLMDYLRLKKYPSWIKNEMRRWKKEKIYGAFIVNTVKEGIVELYDIPAVRSSYWVVTSDVWESIKPGDQIITLILPWKSHYFFGDKVNVFKYRHHGFLIPPELEIKDINTETIPLLFSAQIFSDMVSADLEPVYRYILSTILPTIVVFKPIENAGDLMWLMQIIESNDIEEGMKFFDELEGYLDELFRDSIVNDELRYRGIEISVMTFLMYIVFLLFSSELFDIDFTSLIFDVGVVNYNKDDYEYYLNKVNKKFKGVERDIAVTLLYLLVLRYSNGGY